MPVYGYDVYGNSRLSATGVSDASDRFSVFHSGERGKQSGLSFHADESISAKETTQNKIDLLRLGADDYITKPFDMEEVLARIESNLRRVQFENRSAACLQYGDLCLALDGNVGASVQDNNLKIILEL